VLVLLPSSLARIRREDRVLGRAFPGLHPHYMQRVAALLPTPSCQSIAPASTPR
jgi:protein-S-isoprenylcysteine O-methyltransferase Ste14